MWLPFAMLAMVLYIFFTIGAAVWISQDALRLRVPLPQWTFWFLFSALLAIAALPLYRLYRRPYVAIEIKMMAMAKQLRPAASDIDP